MTPNLTDMPNKILLMIMERTDFVSIQVLRKVCRDFRDFIENVHPTVPVDKYWIESREAHVKVKFDSNHCIIYEKKVNGIWIYHFGKTRIHDQFFENSTFEEMASRNMELFSKIIKSSKIVGVLNFSMWDDNKEFIENYMDTHETVLETYKTFFESNKITLRVKKLRIAITSEDQLMSVLPYLEPGTLQEIETSESRTVDSMDIVDFSRFVKCEQFKKAKILKFHHNFVNIPLMEFLHLDHAQLSLRTISLKDVLDLKEKAQQSSSFVLFDIKYIFFDDQHELSDVFGPHQSFTFCGGWYFKIPRSEYYLEINHFSHSSKIQLRVRPRGQNLKAMDLPF